MTRIMANFIIISLISSPLAKAEWKRIGEIFAAAAPQVSSPAARQIGISNSHMVVVNGTPFYCRIIVYGKEVARLAPGDAAYDNRRWEPLNPQVPIAALAYADEYKKYIGASGRIFNLSSGYSYARSWVIHEYEIRKPDGQYIQKGYAGIPVYPLPDTRLKSRKVCFPREWWNASSGMQVVNNTLFSMSILVDGKPRGSVQPGGVYYIQARKIYGETSRIGVFLMFTDRGRLIGTYREYLYVPVNGAYARQIIVSPWIIR